MAMFRGQVTKDGKGVSGARVGVWAAGFFGGKKRETQTASDGRFAVDVDACTRVHVYVNGSDKGEYRVADTAWIAMD